MGSVQGMLRTAWMRATIGSLICTILFMIFFSAVPSAILTWFDTFDWVEAGELWGVPDLAPKIRDFVVVTYYGVITPLTFVAFSLWQRLHPVNADADEAKREAGGYR